MTHPIHVFLQAGLLAILLLPATLSMAETSSAVSAPLTVESSTLFEDVSTRTDVNSEPVVAAPLPTAGSPADQTASTTSSNLPRDLTPWGMFMAADWVVKAVMIGLAIASLVTWTIWLSKSLELARARRTATSSLAILNESSNLAAALHRLSSIGDTAATMAQAAHAELALSADAADKNGIKERVHSRMERILAAAGREIIRGTGPLATIGSTAPFVGLFGTVWGIMNSFIGISESQSTSLAVVAPGIAEALLATAIGLVAAIPAVIIYNQFSRAITSYRGLLGDAAAAVERLISRDLDRAERPDKLARLKAID